MDNDNSNTNNVEFSVVDTVMELVVRRLETAAKELGNAQISLSKLALLYDEIQLSFRVSIKSNWNREHNISYTSVDMTLADAIKTAERGYREINQRGDVQGNYEVLAYMQGDEYGFKIPFEQYKHLTQRHRELRVETDA